MCLDISDDKIVSNNKSISEPIMRDSNDKNDSSHKSIFGSKNRPAIDNSVNENKLEKSNDLADNHNSKYNFGGDFHCNKSKKKSFQKSFH